MLGAIIGDIVGSRFEWNNNRSKQFDFLTYKCSVTDDSIMSLAIAKALQLSSVSVCACVPTTIVRTKRIVLNLFIISSIFYTLNCSHKQCRKDRETVLIKKK